MNEDKKRTLAEIERIAREIAAENGLEIVEFVFHGQGRHSLLRIDIDRPGVPGVGLADCEALSRALDQRIDDLPFFGTTYELQVSSPGIDRPIRTDDDVRRNAGRTVWLEFQDDAGKTVELRGTLGELEPDGAVTVVCEGAPIHLARERIVFMRQDVAVGSRKRNKP
jgi:ribosome maturation factor RimP